MPGCMYENTGMTNLPDLHDGFFDGVWLSPGKDARLFVRTEGGERSTIVLGGVEALNVCGMRAGNIILDLALIASDKLTLKHIEQAYDLSNEKEGMSRRLLSQAQEQGLSGLEISPSYGAECTVLFRVVDTIPEHVLA
jgi:hypothetical protein